LNGAARWLPFALAVLVTLGGFSFWLASIDTDQSARLGELRESYCAHIENDHKRVCNLRAAPVDPTP
jgi:hypothetical protein